MTKIKKLHKKNLDQPLLRKNLTPPANWDLYTDGISYSLLSKFVVCRERFRLRVVEGLVPSERREAMEFGTIFHKALELSAQGYSTPKIAAYLSQKSGRRRRGSNEYDPLLCRIASAMVPLYKEFWKEELAKIKYFETEKVFDFKYRTTLGKIIPVRGKRDEGFFKANTIWLQENKTMSQVQEEKIIQTLHAMIQPMIYLMSFQRDHPGQTIGGILYNIIRKPGLKIGKQSESLYIKRIVDDINGRPDHYFKMYEIPITSKQVDEWTFKYFEPLMCQLVMWWESIRENPFDPWVGKDGLPNPHHFLRPFGIYDPMSHGIGDYYSRIVYGNDVGLVRNTELFPELQED